MKKDSNEKDKKYCFEVLILDPNGKSEILSPKSLVYGLMSTEKLWENAKSEEKDGNYSINDGPINLKIKPVDTSSTLYDLIEAGFLIKIISFDFEKLEKFRHLFVIHLRNRLSFEHIRILTDDISTEISNKTYPLINELENLLRRYIAKFFTQKIGLDWWEKTVPDKVIEKTKIRTGNESVFSNIVKTDLTLIDFDDLGEIIYKHKLGFNRPQNLADSLVSITTIEELEKLKADLDSNYNRFFKQNFQVKEFDKKWKQLFKIRNKVAHNNLFVLQDLETTTSLHMELKEIILTAESKIDEFKFSVEEQVAIRETISEKEENNETLPTLKVLGKVDISQFEKEDYQSPFEIITEEEFLKALERAEKSIGSSHFKYVGLKSFITKLLGSKGYSFGPSYALANILKEQEKVEIYDIEDETSYWPVKAIRKK